MNLLYPACLLFGIAATWLAVSVFYAVRKARRAVTAMPLPEISHVRIVEQRRWEA